MGQRMSNSYLGCDNSQPHCPICDCFFISDSTATAAHMHPYEVALPFGHSDADVHASTVQESMYPKANGDGYALPAFLPVVLSLLKRISTRLVPLLVSGLASTRI